VRRASDVGARSAFQSGLPVRPVLAPFRARAAQEFETSRRVVEETRDAHGRAATTRDVCHVQDRAARRANQRPCPVVRCGLELELRHGTNRRQRLATKAEASYADEVVRGANLRRRVSFERHDGILARHTAAVVADSNTLTTAVFDREIDRGRAGVERVLDQFLDDGRWAFDDLARGDLVGDRAGQNGNACGCDEGERHREKLPVRRTKRQLPPICAASITSSETRSDASSQPSRPSSRTTRVQAP